MIKSGLRRSADEPRPLLLPVELAAFNGSGRGILLADKITVGAKEFWSGDHVLENGARVGTLLCGPTTW